MGGLWQEVSGWSFDRGSDAEVKIQSIVRGRGKICCALAWCTIQALETAEAAPTANPAIADEGHGEPAAQTAAVRGADVVTTRKQGVKLVIQSLPTVDQVQVSPSHFSKVMDFDETVVTNGFALIEEASGTYVLGQHPTALKGVVTMDTKAPSEERQFLLNNAATLGCNNIKGDTKEIFSH